MTDLFESIAAEHLGPIVWTLLKSPLSWVLSTSWVFSNHDSNEFRCM